MTNDINIFEDCAAHPLEYYKPIDKPAELLNIVYLAGTLGNFVRFFVDKFSKLTPDIIGDPFTEDGFAHNHTTSSRKKIMRYHASFLANNIDKTNLPVCVITASTFKHYLYIMQAQQFRAADFKKTHDLLWQKPIGEMPKQMKPYAEQIVKLYGIKDTAYFTWIPKFIVRDYFKLEFLKQQKQTYYYKYYKKFREHEFFSKQKVFEFDMEAFFDWQVFLNTMMQMDKTFKLQIDFAKKEQMQKVFDKSYGLDKIRKECNFAIEVLDNKTEEQIKSLNVCTEAFIYAEIEKRNQFIQTPFMNKFFRDADEIKQYIEYYPNHYKAMNPNMPVVNGFKNPYYIKKTPGNV